MTNDNPFVGIHPVVRCLLMIYILATSFLVPVLSFGFYDDEPLEVQRLLAVLLVNVTVYWPIFYFRNSTFGWLHPFILPTLYRIAKSFAKSPDSFLENFIPHPPAALNTLGMEQLSLTDVALAQVNHDLLIAFSWVIVYFVFFSLGKLKVPKLKLGRVRYLVPKLLCVASIGVAIGLYVVWRQGGIEQSIYAMGFGRFRQREALGGGHFTVFSTLLSLSCFLWFAYRRSARYNPIFYLLFFSSLLIDFVQTGSRSGLLYQFIILFCLYIAREKKLPVIPIASVGIAGMLLFGVLGQLRTSSNTGDSVNWEVFTSTSIEEKLDIGIEQISLRPNGTYMVLGESMSETGPLWGRSYVGIFTFFVPRFIWPNKPRGGGAFAASLLLDGSSLKRVPSGGKGQSIPISWQAEAFWNFHLFGVILAAAFAGLFYRFVVNLYVIHRGEPFIWMVYIYGVMNFSPRSDGAIVFIQDLVLLIGVAFIIGAWKPIHFRRLAVL